MGNAQLPSVHDWPCWLSIGNWYSMWELSRTDRWQTGERQSWLLWWIYVWYASRISGSDLSWTENGCEHFRNTAAEESDPRDPEAITWSIFGRSWRYSRRSGRAPRTSHIIFRERNWEMTMEDDEQDSLELRRNGMAKIMYGQQGSKQVMIRKRMSSTKAHNSRLMLGSTTLVGWSVNRSSNYFLIMFIYLPWLIMLVIGFFPTGADED